MWDPDLRFPFIDAYCAEHGPEEFFAKFFGSDNNLIPDAPPELREEVAIIRGEIEPAVTVAQ